MAVVTTVLWALSLSLLWTESCQSRNEEVKESKNGQNAQYIIKLDDVMADLDTFQTQASHLVQKYGRLQGHCTLVAREPMEEMEEKPTSCADTSGTGVTTIYPDGVTPLTVSCDQDTDGGGWIVFQRRQDGSVDFYRNWTQYQQGFGDPSGEFWLGLDALHTLTSSQTVELRVDLMMFNGTKGSATFSNFSITNSSDNYRLLFGSFTGGNAGDSLTYHRGRQFSTWDRDNDSVSNSYAPCAVVCHGAWWFNFCRQSSLNGKYNTDSYNSAYDGLVWTTFGGGQYSMKFTEMKLRPTPAVTQT